MEEHLKDLFARFQEQFGSGPGFGPGPATCLLKIEGIDHSFIKAIFKASSALYRTDPWKKLRPEHLFGVRIGKDSDRSSHKHPFPCVQFIGGGGGDLGFHMFRSESDAQKMTSSRETCRIPNIDVLRFTLIPKALMCPSNRKMLKSLSLDSSGSDKYPVLDVAKCTSTDALRFRYPTLEELKYVYLFMNAISLVLPLLQQSREPVPKRSRFIIFDPLIETVDVQWPPEDSKISELIAVTISHPPGKVYEEKSISSVKFSDHLPREEHFLKANLNWALLRQCIFCNKEIHGEQSLCCSRCEAVVYCGPICQKQHWKEEHKSMCGLYKSMMEREEELVMKIFTFPCFVDHPCKWLESIGLHQKGMWRRKCSCYSHCPFGLLSNKGSLSNLWGDLNDGDYPPDAAFVNHVGNVVSNPILLSSWSEYYNLRSLPLSSPVASILSHPLTLFHILTTLSIRTKNLLLKGKEVILHYLGPEYELDWMPAFAEIGHLLNGVGNTQIIMVGPEIPSNLSGTMSGIGSRVRVNLIKGLYQDEATYLPSPHIIVALNCGLRSFGTWGGALDLIRSQDVPVFFTDQSEIACAQAKQVLRNAGLQITHPVIPNPFRSPVRNQTPSNNLPSFSNGFIFGVNT